MSSNAPKSGPTAKKDPADRLGHRSKAEQAKTDVIDAGASLPEITIPLGLEPSSEWHPAALAFWNTYLSSPLRAYYEGTDIATAWYTCELISNSIKGGTPAGQSQHIRMYLADLGATEAARRAMDIKISRTEPEDPAKVVTAQRVAERRAARQAQ